MKPEFSLMEEECGFKVRTKKRTHKRVYHGLLSRKAFIRTTTQRTMTTQRRRDSNMVSLFSQESLNPPQENSTSDLDDAFQNCHRKSDDRREVLCKRLERKNLELFRVLKKSETQLGLAKKDCMDINRAYKSLKIEARCTKAEQ